MKITIKYANDTFKADFTDDGIEEAARQFSIMLQLCGYHAGTVKDYIDIDNDCVSPEDYIKLTDDYDKLKNELFEAKETISVKFTKPENDYNKLKEELFEAREIITKGFTSPPEDDTYWVDRIYHNSIVKTHNKDMEAMRFKFAALKTSYDALTLKLSECRSNNSVKHNEN